MRISICTFYLAVMLLAACHADRPTAPVPHPPRANVSLNLGTDGATPLYQSGAVAINDSGVIVGSAQFTPGDRNRVVEWRPPDYQLTILPDDGNGLTRAIAISRDGTVAGSECDSIARNCRPVYWRDGVLHHLDGFGSVRDVCSCDGQTLVGRTSMNGHDHAAIWENDILIDLGVPDGRAGAMLTGIAHGYIIGIAYNNTEDTGPTGKDSYRWSPTTGWVLLAKGVTVGDVNSRGSVIGGFGAYWPDGSDVGTGIDGEGLPAAINDSNVVAGNCVPNPPGEATDFRPCEWDVTHGWRAIGTEVNSSVYGINNANLAVGNIYDAVANRSFAVLWRP